MVVGLLAHQNERSGFSYCNHQSIVCSPMIKLAQAKHGRCSSYVHLCGSGCNAAAPRNPKDDIFTSGFPCSRCLAEGRAWTFVGTKLVLRGPFEFFHSRCIAASGRLVTLTQARTVVCGAMGLRRTVESISGAALLQKSSHVCCQINRNTWRQSEVLASLIQDTTV
jgi:hypothetical protein